MKNLRNIKGITLIALVLTIIIILILAGISVSIIAGDNSTLKKVAEAKQKTEISKEEENEKIDQYSSIVDQSLKDKAQEESKDEGILFQRDELVFDGTEEKFENGKTGIKLFNEKNINKDFEIKLTFDDKIIDGQVEKTTILNSSDEIDETYVGFYIRIAGGKIVIKGQSVKDGTKTEVKLQESVLKEKEIKIVRIDKIIYVRYGNEEKKLLDNPSTTYETELTFGGIIGPDGADRLFKGNLYNISVNIGKEKQEKPDGSKATLLAYEGSTLDTTVASNPKYINTGIKLFDEDNWEKDFEVSFKIDEFGTNDAYATLFNAFIEKENQWRGVLLRYQNSKIHLEVNNGSGKKTREWDVSSITQITMKRINKKFYYSINNSTEDTFLEDLSTITLHSIPATFGCSIDYNKDPAVEYRFFKGILSNMKIYIEP